MRNSVKSFVNTFEKSKSTYLFVEDFTSTNNKISFIIYRKNVISFEYSFIEDEVIIEYKSNENNEIKTWVLDINCILTIQNQLLSI